jgi:hypothetical protein
MLVILGSHWPANDPIVEQYPDIFSSDPTYGLVFSQKPYVAQPVLLTDPDSLSPKVTAPKVETATNVPGEKKDVTKK